MKSAELRLPGFLKRLGRRSSVVGIDSGSFAMRAMRLTGTEEKLVVSSALLLPAASEPDERKRALAGQKLTSRAAMSIADEKVESHDFKLPRLAKKELDTAIEWEIKKTVASPEFVFHDVLSFEAEKGYEIQCVVASKEIVKSRFDEGKACGIVPAFLETESSALAACAAFMNQDRELHRVALVDLGYSSFRLVFIHRGRVSFTRSLYFGVSTLCHQVAAQVSLRPEDIQELFRHYGSPAPEALKGAAPTLERGLQESLYTLCEELRRSEFYLKEQKALEEIEEIILCGGGACLAAVPEYLGRHLSDKKISLLNPLRAVKQVPKDLRLDSGPAWACAFGLALRQGK